jgi:hypothetical protein
MVRYVGGTLPDNHRLSHDPLRQEFAFCLSERVFPLGFPLEVNSNDERVLEGARRSFSGFAERFEAAPMRVSVAVQPGKEPLPADVIYRGLHHLFSIVCDGHNHAVADLRDGVGYAWITEGVADRIDWFRHRFLEAIVYSALVQERLTPIHAACVARNGRGLLLCAPPGTGKSSLAYACTKQGWTFVTDDAAYLVNADSDDVVLGKPGAMRFKGAGVQLFPELGSLPQTPDIHGVAHIELEAGDLAMERAERCQVHRVVFLERVPGITPAVRRLDRTEALERLLADIPLYEARVQANHRAALGRLLCHEPLILSYPEYTAAMPLLESLVS